MNIEYFGRQYEITPAVRDEIESVLGKLRKILGDNFKSKVILTLEKHRNIAEITVSRVGTAAIGTTATADIGTTGTADIGTMATASPAAKSAGARYGV